MFNFFCNLFLSIFTGTNCFNYDSFIANGINQSYSSYGTLFQPLLVFIGNFFNETVDNTLNLPTTITIFGGGSSTPFSTLTFLIACVLSTICCVSVFLIVVKALKWVLDIFFIPLKGTRI